MKEHNSLDSLLNQVAELLKQVQDHKAPISNISPETIDQLSRLEQAVEMFNELNHNVNKASDIDIDFLRAELYRSTTQTPKNKQFLLRARKLEQDAKKLQAYLAKSLNHKSSSKSTLNKEEQAAKNFRKKFRSLGSKGWMPL